MNVSNLLFRLAIVGLVGAGFVYVAHSLVLDGLTPMGEFSIAGLLWCAGLSFVFAVLARVLGGSRQ